MNSAATQHNHNVGQKYYIDSSELSCSMINARDAINVTPLISNNSSKTKRMKNVNGGSHKNPKSRSKRGVCDVTISHHGVENEKASASAVES